jgi:hypothetical protein
MVHIFFDNDLSHSTHSQKAKEEVIVTAKNMSISFELHFCLPLSPLIAMFSMMGSGNTSTLRGKPRFLAFSTELRGIAE